MNVKKLVVLVLILCLLCGTPALAVRGTKSIEGDGGSQEMTVSYEITGNRDFTVTIPPALSIIPGTESTDLNVTINAENVNVPEFFIEVCLTGAANGSTMLEDRTLFYLSNGSITIPYTIQLRSGYYADLDGCVADWRCGSGFAAEETYALKVAVDPPEGVLPAGTYTDKLTFTIRTFEPDPM